MAGKITERRFVNRIRNDLIDYECSLLIFPIRILSTVNIFQQFVLF